MVLSLSIFLRKLPEPVRLGFASCLVTLSQDCTSPCLSPPICEVGLLMPTSQGPVGKGAFFDGDFWSS